MEHGSSAAENTCSIIVEITCETSRFLARAQARYFQLAALIAQETKSRKEERKETDAS